MATFKPVVFTTKNHIKSDGTTNIKIRIYHNKEAQYIPTPYYINPAHFNNGAVTELCENYSTLNFEIGELTQLYLKNYINIGNSHTSKMNCMELKEYLIKTSNISDSFIDIVKFSKTIIEETKKQNTAEWYDGGIKALCWYYKKTKIGVMEITTNRMTDLMKKLSESGLKGSPLEPGGVSAYMRAIRSLFNKCKLHYNDEDFGIIKIKHDPFKRIEIPKAQRKKKNIPVEIVKSIRDFPCIKKRDELARDMFMIMFYLMGINVNDLFCIEKLTFGRVYYERSKTDRSDNVYKFPLSIRIEPELKPLIEKYSKSGFLSEIKSRYSNSHNFMQAVNKGLKNICKELEVQKITTNWARHSWASIARNKARVPKADIDFCLGHVNNDYKMADVYIDIDYSIFDDANRKVLDLLK
ncbi:MAG: transposase [Porphyromonadaceae bacterium]|nr:transposase [Porphyromonadaceae bacterium]